MPEMIMEPEVKEPEQLRLYDMLAEARKREVFDYFFSKKGDELTVEELLEFSDVSLEYVRRLMSTIERMLKQVPQDELPSVKAHFYEGSRIDLLPQNESQMCRKYINSLPTNDEIMALVRRHIEPLGFSEAEGYKVELSQPRMSSHPGVDLKWQRDIKEWAREEGATVDQLFEKLRCTVRRQDEHDAIFARHTRPEYLAVGMPGNYYVECTISRREGEQTRVFTATIFISVEKIEEEENRYMLEWTARSIILNKEYVDAKLSESHGKDAFYLLACCPDIEKIEKVCGDLRWEKIPHIMGKGSRNGSSIDSGALLKSLKDPDFHHYFQRPELEKLLEAAREYRQSGVRVTN